MLNPGKLWEVVKKRDTFGIVGISWDWILLFPIRTTKGFRGFGFRGATKTCYYLSITQGMSDYSIFPYLETFCWDRKPQTVNPEHQKLSESPIMGGGNLAPAFIPYSPRSTVSGARFPPSILTPTFQALKPET